MFESHTDLTIRRLEATDLPALERLAQRDSAVMPTGSVLAAIAPGGALLAAISLDSHDVIADPFLHSEPAVGLLRVRARQINGDPDEGRRRRRFRRRRSHAALAGSPPGAGGRLLELNGMRPPS